MVYVDPVSAGVYNVANRIPEQYASLHKLNASFEARPIVYQTGLRV